ncbi:SLC13 family permease [Evansella cellulosilytica]|uniref:Citrate transporter n=1 Tax=Evansella cellulosilytica (strain ATCC 21833 / DSM 2522 / FERM P-1141 / JCM 9156 / N-4) TaxID=649639 RepID=E6TYB7_EVAC2|nr:SLC13 family permease [Evansella cellulosilytica]ADU28855.1 Citrate transporter [Evansella cellulosilytica DSM 2522]
MISEMQLVFLILAITTICFLVPRFRADLVAAIALLSLLLTGLITVPEAFAGFSNTVVIMVAALFIVGEGVFQSGLAQKAGNLLIKTTKNSEWKLTVFMLILVAVLSGFISNTGTVAILLPVVVSLCRQMQLHPGKLLIPLAFASSMGGALTLIGTAPNLIASESLQDAGYGALNFFTFTPIGLIMLLVGIIYLWFVGRKMLDKPIDKRAGESEKFNAGELVDQYGLTDHIFSVKIPEGNELIGKSIKELRLPSTYSLMMLEVIKKESKSFKRLTGSRQAHPISVEPTYVIEADDIFVVYGEGEAVERLMSDTGALPVKNATHKIEESHLAEVILTPQSRLINKTIREVNFREKYGLTVLAMKHQFEDARRFSDEETLLYGDAILVHGNWKEINLLSAEKNDTVVLKSAAEDTELTNQTHKSWIAGFILLGMLLAMVFEWVPAVVAIVVAAVLMVLTDCVRQTDQAYQSINWQTVILIACMLPMATALENTGGVTFISEGLIGSLGVIGPLAVLAGLYAITSLFSQFISNTATAVLLFPVAILTAEQMGVSPIPMVMAVAFSSSMAFATPVATPPNAMVMAAGKYTFLDFIKVGIPLQILIALVAILLLPMFFPF